MTYLESIFFKWFCD